MAETTQPEFVLPTAPPIEIRINPEANVGSRKRRSSKYKSLLIGGLVGVIVVGLLAFGWLMLPKKRTVGEKMIGAGGIEFVWIPPGTFSMGSSEEDIANLEKECIESYSDCDFQDEAFGDERPKREITLEDGFWIGRFEVTQGQYEEIIGKNPSEFVSCGKDCPVEKVSWDEAKQFVEALNRRDKEFVYSLPTEAEWEYAARAGNTALRYASLSDSAWFGDNSGDSPKNAVSLMFSRGYEFWLSQAANNKNRTQPVGKKSPNAWGLHDMYGNVTEWTEDAYQEGYRGLPVDGSANNTIGDTSRRIARGGSYLSVSVITRSAFRATFKAIGRDKEIGLRVVARER